MNSKNFYLVILFVIISLKLIAQDSEFTRSAIKTGVGLAANFGFEESGFGIIYSVGYQKSFGKNEKLRINPNLLYGGFIDNGILSSRQQFYRITSLGMNVNYDLIKYKAISILVTTGVFVNYTRGLFGADEEFEKINSKYFYEFYFGGTASVGIRINPKKSKFAYEIKPYNIQFGNKEFILGYVMFGMDIKIKNKK